MFEGLLTGVEKANLDIDLARKKYFPDMELRVSYGQRDDDPVSGQDRADFVSAQASFTVPLWKKKRQDSKLAGSELRLSAAEKALQAFRYSLPHRINSLATEIRSLERRHDLFADAVTTQSAHLVEASMAAYEVGKVEFGTMLAAHTGLYRSELMVERYRYLIRSKIAELNELVGGVLGNESYSEEEVEK